MPRRTIRLTADIDERLQSTAKRKGYANPSAFLRAAIDHELSGREDTMIGAGERLAASMEHIRREIFRLGRAQQALFAFVESLAKAGQGPRLEPHKAVQAAVRCLLQVSEKCNFRTMASTLGVCRTERRRYRAGPARPLSRQT